MDGIAWHTPEITSTGTVTRSMTVPVDLLSYVGGALGMLAESYNWIQVGDAIVDIIELVQTMIDSWYTQEMIGGIMAFVTTPPAGWQPLDGSVLDADLFPELAVVVPDSWILGSGDIQLPNLAGTSLVGHGTSYEIGTTGGEENHTLTLAEIPAHTHTYTPPILNIDIEGPGVPDIVAAGLGPTASTGSAGSGDPHNNMPPFLVVVWAIFTGRNV